MYRKEKKTDGLRQTDFADNVDVGIESYGGVGKQRTYYHQVRRSWYYYCK
jgi:hypothetical protein